MLTIVGEQLRLEGAQESYPFAMESCMLETGRRQSRCRGRMIMSAALDCVVGLLSRDRQVGMLESNTVHWLILDHRPSRSRGSSPWWKLASCQRELWVDVHEPCASESICVSRVALNHRCTANANPPKNEECRTTVMSVSVVR